MKAKELRDLIKENYKGHCNCVLHDLDGNISRYNQYNYYPSEGGMALTDEEMDVYWNKELVYFDTHSEPSCVVLTTYPPMQANPIFYFDFYVSDYTEEERKEREHSKEVAEAVKELEKLSGKVVTLNDKGE